MELSYFQRKQFFEQGYLHVPGVLPKVMVDEALRQINHSVGQGMDPEKMVIYRSQSFCPEIQKSEAIVGLLTRTPAWELAESLVGKDKLKPTHAAQIALRFPGMQNPPDPSRPHLDGMHSPHNGVPYGEIHNFTMLVGVFLSDVTGPYSGNFSVWPGTHTIFEEYFREHGPMSLLEGMPKVEMPEPVQLNVKAGDIALVHYQVAHGVTQNVSPNTRYALFFRLTHVDHDAQKFEVMTDIWREWEGVQVFR
jgi:hypothetical protein